MSAVAVHTVISGPADAPVLVLSNSLGSDHRMWDRQIDELATRFRVVRYDTRGHGSSPVPDGPYSIDDLADDLIAVLDSLGVARAHIGGLSLGGMTAMRVAIRNPERVDRLALLCTAAQMPPASGWLDRAAAVREAGTASIAEAVVSRWFTAEYQATQTEPIEYFQQMVAATPAAGYAGCCEAIAAMDQRDTLTSIAAPTLVIAGADDPATPPPMLAEIAEAAQQAHLLVVDHAAHLANVEQADTVTAALLTHLEKS